MRGVNHMDPEVSLAFSRVLTGSFPERAAGIILKRAADSDNAAADRYLSLLEDLDISPFAAELQGLASRGDNHLRASLLRLRLDKGDAGALQEALQLRITSYNVCYTKLLRAVPTTSTSSSKAAIARRSRNRQTCGNCRNCRPGFRSSRKVPPFVRAAPGTSRQPSAG